MALALPAGASEDLGPCFPASSPCTQGDGPGKTTSASAHFLSGNIARVTAGITGPPGQSRVAIENIPTNTSTAVSLTHTGIALTMAAGLLGETDQAVLDAYVADGDSVPSNAISVAPVSTWAEVVNGEQLAVEVQPTEG